MQSFLLDFLHNYTSLVFLLLLLGAVILNELSMSFLQKIIQQFLGGTKKVQSSSVVDPNVQKSLLDKILAITADGKINSDKLQELELLQNDLKLSQQDLDYIKTQAFLTFYNNAKADGSITESEEAELLSICEFLQVPKSAVEAKEKELAKYRLLREIGNGSIPQLTNVSIVLQKKEIAYWSEPCALLEERVIDRKYVGGSRGVSLRIMKGVSYRIGAQRGRMISDRAVVAVSNGTLYITSKRLVFKGDKKSFSLKYDKIIGFDEYSDGYNISTTTGAHKILKFNSNQNIEIVSMIISNIINS